MKRIYRLLAVPLVLVLLLTILGPVHALTKEGRNKILPAAVQLWWVRNDNGNLMGVGLGSGTLVTPDGLILTNYHVANVDEGWEPYLGVALTTRSDRPPQPTYLADVIVADPSLDLAVLRISRKIDGSPVQPESLNLPYVPLGDSDALDVGDELNIFGFPGIGGETVTFTRGVVSGFSLDAAFDGRGWIKTDTTIAGGNSGGTGVDEDGLLVGVPTQAGRGGLEGQDEYVDCRALADTNGDGRIDGKDSCVPIGGFLNALRPINLAKPLIEAARSGLNYQAQGTGAGGNTPVPSGAPQFGKLFFTSGLTEAGQPVDVVTGLPSGAHSLYLFFDYQNMADGLMWEAKVMVNGQEAPDWGLPKGPWSGGEKGTWWLGWSDAAFEDGLFALGLYVQDQKLAEAQIQIAGQVANQPSFSNIVFSQDVTAQGEPIEPSILFPAGIPRLVATFEYENMTKNLDWTRTWYVNGEQALTKTEKWAEAASGRTQFELTQQQGLPAGDWRFQLSIQGKPVAVADFTVAGAKGSGPTFGPFSFVAKDANGKELGAGTSFASGVQQLSVYSDFSGMQNGLKFGVIWYLSGQKALESGGEWDQGASGRWEDVVFANSGSPLPDAEYKIELSVEGQLVQSGTAVIGAGAQPQPTPAPQPANGVQVQGTFTDLDTGKPIAGATFLVLNPGVTVATFQWNGDEVFTSAETDRQGAYKLPRLLERGQCYTMIMGAQNYWAYSEDDVCINAQSPDLVDLPVQLERN